MKIIDATRGQLRRPLVVLFLGAFVVWSAFWGVQAFQDILVQTHIGRGEAGATWQAHEVLEVVIIAAYSGVRWFAGLVATAGLWGAFRLGRRVTASD